MPPPMPLPHNFLLSRVLQRSHPRPLYSSYPSLTVLFFMIPGLEGSSLSGVPQVIPSCVQKIIFYNPLHPCRTKILVSQNFNFWRLKDKEHLSSLFFLCLLAQHMSQHHGSCLVSMLHSTTALPPRTCYSPCHSTGTLSP